MNLIGMRKTSATFSRLPESPWFRCAVLTAVIVASCEWPLFAASPWETIVSNVAASISGPIAHGLSLVAIVVGGLTWAFDDGGGGSKRMLAGILFGVGMAVCAAQFYVWLFGTP